jgi:hypothetical protein
MLCVVDGAFWVFIHTLEKYDARSRSVSAGSDVGRCPRPSLGSARGIGSRPSHVLPAAGRRRWLLRGVTGLTSDHANFTVDDYGRPWTTPGISHFRTELLDSRVRLDAEKI